MRRRQTWVFPWSRNDGASRALLPVDDDGERDGEQADNETLAGSRVRTGLANIDTWR